MAAQAPRKDYKNSSPLTKYCKEHSSPLHPVQDKLVKVRFWFTPPLTNVKLVGV